MIKDGVVCGGREGGVRKKDFVGDAAGGCGEAEDAVDFGLRGRGGEKGGHGWGGRIRWGEEVDVRGVTRGREGVVISIRGRRRIWGRI